MKRVIGSRMPTVPARDPRADLLVEPDRIVDVLLEVRDQACQHAQVLLASSTCGTP
jgi:hypothetical protein